MSLLSNFFKENFHKTDIVAHGGKPRIEFIDLAKGVCILLIVMLHTGFAVEFPAIKAMRMPLYFILSGLFFKDYGNYKRFMVKKTNNLIIPFCFFFILGLIPVMLFSHSRIIESLVSPLFEPQIVNTPIWFLLCLFWVNAIYYIYNLMIKDIWIKSVIVILTGVGGYMLSQHQVYLPLFIGSAFSALPFFYVGILLNETSILYKSVNNPIYTVIALILMGVSIAYCYLRSDVYIEFRCHQYEGNPVEIFLVSVSMVLGLLMICKSIGWLPIVSYLGRYSVIVLGVHWLFMVNISYLIYILTGYLFNGFLRFMTVLLLSWLAIPLFRRYAPALTAQSELISVPDCPD